MRACQKKAAAQTPSVSHWHIPGSYRAWMQLLTSLIT